MSEPLQQPLVRRSRKDLFRTMATVAIVIVLAYIGLLVATNVLLLGTASFSELVTSERTLGAVVLSLTMALGATIIAMVIGVPAAYALSRLRVPGRVVFDTLVDVPIALSPIALGILIVAMFSTGPGRFFETNVLAFTYALPGILAARSAELGGQPIVVPDLRRSTYIGTLFWDHVGLPETEPEGVDYVSTARVTY